MPSLASHLVDSFMTAQPTAPFGQPLNITQSGSHSFNASMHGAGNSSLFFGGGSMDISQDTADRIDRLSSMLSQRLGPEYISQRPGPGGGPKLTYVEGWKLINIANEVFGYNGWSSQVISLQIDYCDQLDSNRFNIGATAIVRVTLRDGVFHEDVGLGGIENAKSKSQAFDKVKKEAVTDALKRALRNFGNLTGNCVYDKNYCNEVNKIKVQPVKFDPNSLHRRPEFDPANASTSSSASSSRPAPQPQQQPYHVSNSNVNIAKPPVPSSSTHVQNSSARSSYPANQQQQRPAPAPQARPPAPPPSRPAPPQQSAPPPPPPIVKREAALPQRDDSFSDFGDLDEETLAMLDADMGPPILHEDDSGVVSVAGSFEPAGHSTVIGTSSAGPSSSRPSPPSAPASLPNAHPGSRPQQQQPVNRVSPEAAAARRAAVAQAMQEAAAPAGSSVVAAAAPRAPGSNSSAAAARLATIEQAMGDDSAAGPSHGHAGHDARPSVPAAQHSRHPPAALGGFRFPEGVDLPMSQNLPPSTTGAAKRTADGQFKMHGEMRQPFAPIQVDAAGMAKRARR